jgi:hypothetical protein
MNMAINMQTLWMTMGSIGLFCSITLSPIMAGTSGYETLDLKHNIIPDINNLEIVKHKGVDYAVYDDMLLPFLTIKGAEEIPANRWPGGILPIVFDATVTQLQQNQFLQACQWWSDVSNINVVNRTTEIDFINVIAGTVNQSFVGQIGGPQDLIITSWGIPGIIAHEIGHAMGLVHEHQQLGRGSYVKILYDNIIPDKVHNFNIINSEEHTVYDFDSIMHYRNNEFTRNGQPTIVPHNSANTARMGQRNQLSLRDSLSAMRMYGENLNNPPVIRMPDVVGQSYSEILGNTLINEGVRLNIRNGPSEYRRERINVCEVMVYFPRITWQAVAPGTLVRFEQQIDVDTIQDSRLETYPPPPGRVCP